MKYLNTYANDSYTSNTDYDTLSNFSEVIDHRINF
jgi:hypothetical protein